MAKNNKRSSKRRNTRRKRTTGFVDANSGSTTVYAMVDKSDNYVIYSHPEEAVQASYWVASDNINAQIKELEKKRRKWFTTKRKEYDNTIKYLQALDGTLTVAIKNKKWDKAKEVINSILPHNIVDITVLGRRVYDGDTVYGASRSKLDKLGGVLVSLKDQSLSNYGKIPEMMLNLSKYLKTGKTEDVEIRKDYDGLFKAVYNTKQEAAAAVAFQLYPLAKAFLESPYAQSKRTTHKGGISVRERTKNFLAEIKTAASSKNWSSVGAIMEAAFSDKNIFPQNLREAMTGTLDVSKYVIG